MTIEAAESQGVPWWSKVDNDRWNAAWTIYF